MGRPDVAIGHLGHDRPANTRLRLFHQTLQLRRSDGEPLAFGFQLLAIVKRIFRRVGESPGHFIAHAGAAAQARAKREQRCDRKRARERIGRDNNRSGHQTPDISTTLRFS